MIDLTPSAAAKLQSIMTEKSLDGYGLRVYVSGSGCSGLQYGLGFDKARDGDTVETAVGVQTLVDPMSAQYLDGVTIDFVDEEGGGFRIENPNAVAGCGSCGGGEGKGGCCN
jgi:iron-sulfur cluster assembly accessory protein